MGHRWEFVGREDFHVLWGTQGGVVGRERRTNTLKSGTHTQTETGHDTQNIWWDLRETDPNYLGESFGVRNVTVSPRERWSDLYGPPQMVQTCLFTCLLVWCHTRTLHHPRRRPVVRGGPPAPLTRGGGPGPGGRDRRPRWT